MRKTISVFVLAMTAASLGACASTRVSSFVDPKYKGRAYSKILVHVGLKDLEQRSAYESRAVELLRAKGCDGARMMDVYPPTRAWDGATALAVARQANCDAVIELVDTQELSFTYYVPPTYRTQGHVDSGGNFSAVTTTSGGYEVSNPGWNNTIELVDLTSLEVVYRCQAKTRAGSAASLATVSNSIVSEVVDDMVKSGLLKRNPKREE